MTSKTIEIFLPDGEPTGIRIAEIRNRTVQLVAFPRTRLSSVQDISREGIYFLFGTDTESSDRSLVYIGQAKDCLQRIKQHNQDPAKDYWNTAAVVVTKDKSFGTTEIEFLEQLAVNRAKASARFIVKNGVVPPSSNLSNSQKSQMEELFECIELLLPVIGYPVFSNVASSTTQDDVLYCEGAGIKASAKYTDAGMVVLKGSEMRSGTTPTASKGIQYLRKTLVDQAYVSLDADTYIFREDYAFTSPSAAAQVVLGRSANGWTAWKNAAGKTLDEVIRQS